MALSQKYYCVTRSAPPSDNFSTAKSQSPLKFTILWWANVPCTKKRLNVTVHVANLQIVKLSFTFDNGITVDDRLYCRTMIRGQRLD